MNWGGKFQRPHRFSFQKLVSPIMYLIFMCTNKIDQLEESIAIQFRLVFPSFHKHLSLKFWGDDAFLAIVYLINHTPRKIIIYETPLEHLLHQTPDYETLHVFGCACWPNLHPYNTHEVQLWPHVVSYLDSTLLIKASSALTLVLDSLYLTRCYLR